MRRFVTILLLPALLAAAPVRGQLLAETDSPSNASDETPVEKIVRFRVGAVITAKSGPCRNVQAMCAVPLECEEQSIRVVEEDFTKHVSAVDFRSLAGDNARQMLISIPFLESGAEARAVLTYEVKTRTTLPPSESEAGQYAIPRRTPRGLRGYLGPSPFIESKHPRIRRLAREIQQQIEDADPAGAPTDWTRLEALYDYVLDNIEYIDGPDTSALTTLKDESADCHGRSALFVALCRAIGVPARMVWVNEHCYPEFYLQDAAGEGRWIPAESAGTRAFGEMPLARVILQKGDDFRVPERPRDRLRYASDYLVAQGGKPSVKFLREVVP